MIERVARPALAVGSHLELVGARHDAREDDDEPHPDHRGPQRHRAAAVRQPQTSTARRATRSQPFGLGVVRALQGRLLGCDTGSRPASIACYSAGLKPNTRSVRRRRARQSAAPDPRCSRALPRRAGRRARRQGAPRHPGPGGRARSPPRLAAPAPRGWASEARHRGAVPPPGRGARGAPWRARTSRS